MSRRILRTTLSVALVTSVVGCAAETTDERALEGDIGLVQSALVPGVTVTKSDGCPGTVSTKVNPFGSRVIFQMAGSSQSTEFAVASGLDDAPFPEKAECTLTVKLASDQGYQYRLVSLEHHVAYKMPDKGKIRHVSVLKLGDTAEKTKEKSVERGPVSVIDDTFTQEGPTDWSACGLSYSLKATAKLSAKGPKVNPDDPSTLTFLQEKSFFGTIDAQTCELP